MVHMVSGQTLRCSPTLISTHDQLSFSFLYKPGISLHHIGTKLHHSAFKHIIIFCFFLWTVHPSKLCIFHFDDVPHNVLHSSSKLICISFVLAVPCWVSCLMLLCSTIHVGWCHSMTIMTCGTSWQHVHCSFPSWYIRAIHYALLAIITCLY